MDINLLVDSSFSLPFAQLGKVKEFLKRITQPLLPLNLDNGPAMRFGSFGGRSTGHWTTAAKDDQSQIATTIDSLIYFGGEQNVTNLLNRVLFNPRNNWRNSITASVLIVGGVQRRGSTSEQDKIILNILKKYNFNLLVVFVGQFEANDRFRNCILQQNFPIIQIPHWDQFQLFDYQILKYLKNI